MASRCDASGVAGYDCHNIGMILTLGLRSSSLEAAAAFGVDDA